MHIYCLSSHDSAGQYSTSDGTEISLVNGGIIQVTTSDSDCEEMEVWSSSLTGV